MKILLVSATKFEILPFLKRLKWASVNGTLSSYHIGKNSVDVLITGVGMTATAFHFGKNLNKKYDLAINVGVAGSFTKKLELGEVVNVVSDCFGDLGAEDGERFLTLKEMGLGEFKIQNSKFKRINSLSFIKKVKGITVNAVHGNAESIKKVVKKFNPDIESMEGAAFFFACGQFKVPCVQVRAISNYVERRNKKNWRMSLAIKKLNIFLDQFLLGL